MSLTAKQEVFARKVAISGLKHSAAYAAVHDTSKMKPKSVSAAASLLAANPEVSARIKVLQARVEAELIKKAVYSLQDEIRAATEAIENARACGQTAAEVAAIKLRAQLGGHLVEKSAEKKNPLEDLDTEKLLAIRDEVNARLRKAKEALELVGDLSGAPVVPARRVIGG